MKKSLTFFFLTCSFTLVLGHSILPHNHLEEERHYCRFSGDNNLSLFDIIKLTLSYNPCPNHLEEYKNCNLLAITFSDDQTGFLKSDSTVFPVFTFFAIIDKYAITNSKLTSLHYFHGAGLRAPPFKI